MKEVGAPTETEVQKLFGVSAGQLGLERMEITDEENKTLSVYPLELHGVPAEVLAGIRRLRLSSKVKITRSEHFVTPATQIAQGQGESWLSYLAGMLIGKRTKDLGKRGRLALPDYDSLHARACEMQGILTAQQERMYEADEAQNTQPLADEGRFPP